MTSSSPGSRVRPYLVTSADAARLPRWIPLLFCAVYVLAGLFGRDPWRTDDAIGFGIAHTMATGSSIDWLLPNVQGQLVPDEGGPLPFWMGALGMQAARIFNTLLASFLGHAADNWRIAPDLAMRIMAALGMSLTMTLLWYAARNLASRPEIQPQDPFGAGASPQDFGHAVADAALLAVLSCFGVIAPIHETTANAAQMLCMALYLFGLSIAIDRPRRGGLTIGLAIAASLLTYSAALATALLLALLLLLLLATPYRLVAGWVLLTALPTAALGGVIWPALLAYFSHPDAVVQALPLMDGEANLPLDPAASQQVATFFHAWLSWNTAMAGAPSMGALSRLANVLPWYLWPLWPFVLWGMWRWRAGCREAPIAAALIPLLVLLLASLCNPVATDHQNTLTPMVLPMAVLTGITLPMIRRNLVSIVDWFAVMIFSIASLVVWAYWIAFLSGWPPRMAAKAEAALPGFVAHVSVTELVIGLIATGAWVMLVVWRVSRRPRPFWRPMALSSGGMVLTWLLLMTLWLQAANWRKSYQELVMPTRALFASQPGCVLHAGVDAGELALFAYYAGARFVRLPELRQPDDPPRQPACPWLLVSDDTAAPPIKLRSVLQRANASGLNGATPEQVLGLHWQSLWQRQRPFSKTPHLLALYRWAQPDPSPARPPAGRQLSPAPAARSGQ
ncbi:MAG: hypothetical protein Q4B13_05605 [Lautropia sp.]|nr:hypothetical protein [Lautropia sp.]